VELDIEAGLAYPIEAGDLLELGGNLLDNACKYAQRRVRVVARGDRRPGWRRPGLRLAIEDDGPGIPAADRQRVLERGVRADETVAGQGIGLAAAREVAAAYGGSLAIGDSPLGGAAVHVELPGR
jgi:two-component system sensor histidine kinase PhoQ